MTEGNYMQIFEYVAANLLPQPCGCYSRLWGCLAGRDYGWWADVVSPHHKAVKFESHSLRFGMCFALIVPGKHLFCGATIICWLHETQRVYMRLPMRVVGGPPSAGPEASSDIPELHSRSPPLSNVPLIRKIYRLWNQGKQPKRVNFLLQNIGRTSFSEFYDPSVDSWN